MIRVLFIARYRDPTMDRKLVLMARHPDLAIREVRPRVWEDELTRVEQGEDANISLEQTAVAMIGRPADPHRAMYRTPDFGMARFRPHLIHVEEEPDSLAALQVALARRAFAPRAKLLLYTWQNIDRPRAPHVRWVMNRTLAAAGGVLCANQEARAILERHGYRGRLWVLPSIGVDMRTFVPCAGRRPAGTFVAGYVGRLVPEKGLDTLVEAVARLGPEVELVFVGAGSYHAALEARAAAAGLGGRVRFQPPVPPAQVAEHMCRLGALVLPSRTTVVWKEQFGRVLAEAMACRVPVVGSNSGAIPEVIGDAGLVFPEGNIEALAGCLRRLADSPELRRDLAERGYARVRRLYAQEVIAEQTVMCYRSMVEAS